MYTRRACSICSGIYTKRKRNARMKCTASYCEGYARLCDNGTAAENKREKKRVAMKWHVRNKFRNDSKKKKS